MWAGFVPPFFAGVWDCVLNGWFACWKLLVLYRAEAPFSYLYRGGAVRFSVSLGTYCL